jgi:hypothetical protein
VKKSDFDNAKTKSSKPVEMPGSGEALVTGKSGNLLAMDEKIDSTIPKHMGFMKGQSSVPDDFDTMGADEIADLFEGRAALCASS